MRGQNRQVNAADLRRACLWKRKTLPGFVEGEEASMFGIGSTELLVILVVALIVLGPKSLASVSRTLGKAMGEFRRVSTDFQRTLNAESAEADIREKAAEQRRKAAAAGADPAGNSPAEDAPVTAAAPDASPAAVAPDTENVLTPPEGSPLAEALARARAEAGAVPSTANDARATADAAMTTADPAPTPPPAAPSSPDSPTPPVDGPRA